MYESDILHFYLGCSGVPRKSGKLSVGNCFGSGWGLVGPAVRNKSLPQPDEKESYDGGESKQNLLSVLTSETRDLLKHQGRKSPEVVHKRLIIGQVSYDIGKNGELTEDPESASVKEIRISKHDFGTIPISQNGDLTKVGVSVPSYDRRISITSNSDSSIGSSTNNSKTINRNASVWSMTSSLTSVDSNEEEINEQRRILNLQISRNKNSKKDDVKPYTYYVSNESSPNSPNDYDVFLPNPKDIFSQNFGKCVAHKKLRRTSTPKRNRTTSLSNSHAGNYVTLNDNGTIEEEGFISDAEVQNYSKSVSKTEKYNKHHSKLERQFSEEFGMEPKLDEKCQIVPDIEIPSSQAIDSEENVLLQDNHTPIASPFRQFSNQTPWSSPALNLIDQESLKQQRQEQILASYVLNVSCMI